MNKELENTIKRLEEEVNKQAKIIQWYEKENRHNQEIIIDLSKRIDNAVEYIENNLQSFLYSIEYKKLLDILKGVK